ncbi:unnamed protein product [Gordionus sp. m RMFG-2023]
MFSSLLIVTNILASSTFFVLWILKRIADSQNLSSAFITVIYAYSIVILQDTLAAFQILLIIESGEVYDDKLLLLAQKVLRGGKYQISHAIVYRGNRDQNVPSLSQSLLFPRGPGVNRNEPLNQYKPL